MLKAFLKGAASAEGVMHSIENSTMKMPKTLGGKAIMQVFSLCGP